MPPAATVTPTSAALAALVIQQTLFVLLWAVLTRMRMAPRASAHWTAGVLLVTAGLALIVLRDRLPISIGFWGSGLALYGGFVLLLRGIEVFAQRTPRDRWHLAGWLAHAGVLALSIAWGVPWAFVAAASLPLAWVMLRAAATVAEALREEFGPRLARGCAFPFALIGVVLVLRTGAAILWPDPMSASMHARGAGNLGAALLFVALGLILNLGLLALVCARMLMRLQHASLRDMLTGLLNRRGIELHLQALAQRRQRDRRPFSLLSVDVDHFKRINDEHGHPAGDAVLEALGREMAALARAGDHPARAGGEEFWVLLPDTAGEGAQRVAERLQQAVRALRVTFDGAELQVTVSIGIVTARFPGESLQSVMQRLDRALYAAKRLGRDRIEVASLEAIDAAAPQVQAA